VLCDQSMMAEFKCAWKTFCEYFAVLAGKMLLLKLRSRSNEYTCEELSDIHVW